MRGFLALCAAACACACTPAPQPGAAKPAATTTRPAPAPAVATPTTPPAPQADPWLLPGTLGPLTTRLELETRFGKDNVQAQTFPGAEGIGTVPALVVFPREPRKRLELVLDAANPDAPIRELRVRDPGSLWHHRSGLRTGLRLAELVALNGAPVSFYGLGWDYGGTVQDWHGGRLANPVGRRVFHRVTLGARADAGTALPQGDVAFRSDDPRWPGLGQDLEVAEMGISWPHEGDQ